MSDITSTARIDLVANGHQPEEQLVRLKQRASDLRDAIAKAAKEGDKASCKKWESELKSVRREIRNVQSATQNVDDVMRRLDKAAPKELKSTLRTLEKELQGIERGSKAWNAQVAKIKQVKGALAQVNSELAAHESRWQKLARTMNTWQTRALAAVGAFTGFVFTARKAVQSYAEMEQEMANVRKYTGMSAEQVEALNEELKKINTRSGRDELNRLAQEAGRLGKTSKEDVMGFVRAADQINVALDELGADATLQLSKLTQIFGDEQRLGTEKALLAVGSVVNELSQNCAASAPYLTEFAARMGGIGAQAGMTVPQIMGLAAVLDSKGQKVEASATAIAQVITRMYQDPSKYAKAAGLDVSYFADLVRKDANEALMVLSETLNAKGGLKDTAPIFKDMGENGSRAVAALATLAENIKEVRSQQSVANQAFEEGTSVTTEYNVQNNTVQAGLDKAKKNFSEVAIALGEKLLPVMKYTITSTSAMMRALSTCVDFVLQYRTTIIALIASIVAYNVAVNAATIATKLHAAATAVARGATYAWMVAQQAWAAVTAICTGKIHRFSQEVKILSVMLKTSPWGLAIAGVTALAVAMTALLRKQSEEAKMAKELESIRNAAIAKIQDEKGQIDLLVEAAKNENLSLTERDKAIKQLNATIPGYNAYLDETTGKYIASEAALEKYIQALQRKYELEGAKAVITDLGRQKAELALKKEDLKVEEARAKQLQSQAASWHPGTNISTTGAAPGLGGANATTTGAAQMVEAVGREIKKTEDEMASLERRTKAVMDLYGDDLQKEAVAQIAPSESNATSASETPATEGAPGGDRFAALKDWKERMEAQARIDYAIGLKNYLQFTEEMDQISVDYYAKMLEQLGLSETERLSAEADYYEAKKRQAEHFAATSIEKENEAYALQVANAKQNYIDGLYTKSTYTLKLEQLEIEHQKKLVKLTKDGSKERVAQEKKLTDLLLAETERRAKEKEDLEQKYAKLKSDYFGDNPQEAQAKYDTDLGDLTVVYDRELEAAGDNAEERLRIEKAFQDAKLALQKKYGLESQEQATNAMQGAMEGAADWLGGPGGQALKGTIDTVTSSMSAIFSQLSTIVQAEMEIQTAAINKRYDAEIDAAEGNNYQIKQLEKDKEAELARTKKEANRKMFSMQVIQAVAQTAQGAIAAYSSAAAVPVVGWVLAPIAAAAAVAAGMLQVAAIKKQQQASEAQGYAEGGFTPEGGKYDPVGVVHAGEWVASQTLTHNPKTRPFLEALDYVQRTNTIGSFRAGDASVAATRVLPAVTDSATEMAVVASAGAAKAMAAAAEAMSKRLDDPFVTVNTEDGELGMKQAREKYNALIKNKTPKSKR